MPVATEFYQLIRRISAHLSVAAVFLNEAAQWHLPEVPTCAGSAVLTLQPWGLSEDEYYHDRYEIVFE